MPSRAMTGNPITDLREAEGGDASNPSLDLDLVDRPFLEALLANDKVSALRVSTEALALLGRRVAVFSDLLQPAQVQVGELWYAGQIGVADEHRATAIVEAVVSSLPVDPGDPIWEDHRSPTERWHDEWAERARLHPRAARSGFVLTRAQCAL